MAKKQNRGRFIDGILVVNKPQGETSNTTLQRVKRLYAANKAGHTGSLDPLATGVLPICFGEATKFSQYLLDSDKEYLVTAELGVRTNTSDSQGEVVERRPVPQLTIADMEALLENFRGPLQQVPSMFSALKHQGQPLYKFARQGIEIEREARPIMVYNNALIELALPRFQLRIHCSKGTYVRTLIDDMGEMLGCGAHVVSLHRTKAGPYHETQAVDLPQLEQWVDDRQFDAMDDLLLPMASAVSEWPEVQLTENTYYYLQQGQPVVVAKAPVEGWVRLMQGAENFVGVGQILEDGRVAPRRLVVN